MLTVSKVLLPPLLLIGRSLLLTRALGWLIIDLGMGLCIPFAGVDYYRFLVDGHRAERAFRTGHRERARFLAHRQLRLAEDHPDDWFRGNAVQQSRQILGLLALEEGDLDGAGQHLLKMGRAPGSPTLCSFGPATRLARALLEAGRTEVVLDYLEACRNLWSHGFHLPNPDCPGSGEHPELLEGGVTSWVGRRGYLDHWRDQILAGRIPSSWSTPSPPPASERG